MEKKICSKCGIEKDISEYCKHKRLKDGINTWCKDCCNDISKNYNKNNKEKIKENRKQWRINNREVIKKRNDQWKENNKEYKIEYRKNNIIKIKEYSKQYGKEHQHIYNFNTQSYRAKKKKLPSTFTLEQWNYVKKYFDNRCAYCGEEKPLEQDHFVALSKGGSYAKENIIPSCKSCNCSKKDKVFEEWYHKQKYYNKSREIKIYEFLKINKGEII